MAARPSGLAAELQWSLLPPLTYAAGGVTVAGALEPAYDIAGDTIDYAVDFGTASAAGCRSDFLQTCSKAWSRPRPRRWSIFVWRYSIATSFFT